MLKIEDLLRKYNSGQCTTEEKPWLEQWYKSFDYSNQGDEIPEDKIESLRNEVWSALHKRTVAGEETKIITPVFSKAPASRKWWRYAAAAVFIIGVVGIGFYFLGAGTERIARNNTVKSKALKTSLAKEDIIPGSSKAQLVLANGSVISLDSVQGMQLTENDGTRIDKQSGKIIYSDNAAGNGKILYNTLSTPRGGEYQLVLPDHSKVWLNAASSLRFPTRFEAKERTVFLEGEAYFEVAKNAKMPFRVIVDKDMTVEVLGTHFNIMSYTDEAEVKTTLAEGMVRVTKEMSAVVLSPAKQAVLKKSDQILKVSDADVDKALAWKNGMIEFDGDELPYIMRQLSRWYDVDVKFEGEISRATYKGAIRRQAPLSKVLEILRAAGVQFRMGDAGLMVTGG